MCFCGPEPHARIARQEARSGMDEAVLSVGSQVFALRDILVGSAALALALLIILVIATLRANRQRQAEAADAALRAEEFDSRVAELNRMQAELSGRLQSMTEVFGGRQSDMTKTVADRLDHLRHSVGAGLQQSAEKQFENLQKLNERLAVIDAAQTRLTDLTSEVLVLKDVLANKQARGAYGQGRLEAIIRDGLPASAYSFQAMLSNRSRPDCLIHLPGDDKPLAIDAKFPLEAFTALREAQGDEGRAAAERRVRHDLSVHIRDIAEKYVRGGETQDLAMLFVPSEALYADLCEKFEDVVQRAHRARVIIVSPSLLMMAVQVIQALVRDGRMRDQAREIQNEVHKLLDDVRRVQERAGKLDMHFRQAQEDVAGVITSADKVNRRSERIMALEFSEDGKPPLLARAAE
jgi:DNA recombination protein RmuC